MMELIVAVLIALGALTSEGEFSADYRINNQDKVSRAQRIIDNGQYRVDQNTGGVTIDQEIGT